MTEIIKKTWPEFFEQILKGEKKFELRLADFEVKEGDILVLKEYNPKKKEFTGRKIKKIVGKVVHVNPAKMYSLDEIEANGFNIIELK